MIMANNDETIMVMKMIMKNEMCNEKNENMVKNDVCKQCNDENICINN